MRSTHGWQLILADLSLILFLVTLTALVGSSSEETKAMGNTPYVAPAQALYRKVEDGPDLSEWLSEQPLDPRATLTIIAQHTANERDAVWQEAQDLAQSAAGSGVEVRVVLTSADNGAGGETPKSDIYASLAYDIAETDLAETGE